MFPSPHLANENFNEETRKLIWKNCCCSNIQIHSLSPASFFKVTRASHPLPPPPPPYRLHRHEPSSTRPLFDIGLRFRSNNTPRAILDYTSYISLPSSPPLPGGSPSLLPINRGIPA